jgi:hypothetical protein
MARHLLPRQDSSSVLWNSGLIDVNYSYHRIDSGIRRSLCCGLYAAEPEHQRSRGSTPNVASSSGGHGDK